ncbi:MAG: class I SAM-dependent methyltransferase [bacterium]
MPNPNKLKASLKATKSARCLFCGTVQGKIVVRGDTFGYPLADLVCCPLCHLRWLDPLPSPSRILEFYPDEYYGVQNEKFYPPLEYLLRFIHRLRAEKAIRLKSNKKRVLDIGCGRGQVLKVLSNRGYECYGTELSSFSAQGASFTPGLHIYAKPLLECLFPSCSFGLIIMWHVLEHLPNPREIIQEIFRILSPGGNLLMCVPNIESFQAAVAKDHWFHLDLPRHLYHYNPATLSSLLKSAGFIVIRQHTFSLEQGPFGLLQSFLNMLGLPPNALYQALHRTWKKQKISLSRALLQSGISLFSLPFLTLVCSLSSLLGRGGVIEIQAQKPKKPRESAL